MLGFQETKQETGDSRSSGCRSRSSSSSQFKSQQVWRRRAREIWGKQEQQRRGEGKGMRRRGPGLYSPELMGIALHPKGQPEGSGVGLSPVVSACSKFCTRPHTSRPTLRPRTKHPLRPQQASPKLRWTSPTTTKEDAASPWRSEMRRGRSDVAWLCEVQIRAPLLPASIPS